MPAQPVAETDLHLVPADHHDEDSCAQCAALASEVEHLQLALQSRTTIGTAIGLLAERHRCSSAQAWTLLQRLSSHSNRKVRDVARLLVAVVDGDLRAEEAVVAAELARHLPTALAAVLAGAEARPG